MYGPGRPLRALKHRDVSSTSVGHLRRESPPPGGQGGVSNGEAHEQRGKRRIAPGFFGGEEHFLACNVLGLSLEESGTWETPALGPLSTAALADGVKRGLAAHASGDCSTLD